jgi:hypothetical protein
MKSINATGLHRKSGGEALPELLLDTNRKPRFQNETWAAHSIFKSPAGL